MCQFKDRMIIHKYNYINFNKEFVLIHLVNFKQLINHINIKQNLAIISPTKQAISEKMNPKYSNYHLLVAVLLERSCFFTISPGVSGSKSVGGVNTSLSWGVCLYNFRFFF